MKKLLALLATLMVAAPAYAYPPQGSLVVQDEGTSLKIRLKLNFVGGGVACVDDATNKRTNCTIGGGGGGGGYDTVKNNGTSLTQRTAVNFDGTNLVATDNAGASRTDITLGSGVTTNAGSQTLTNKTLTAPVLGGTVTGTYTLGGTPTVSAPILSGSVTGTYTLAGTPSLGASVTMTTATYAIGDTTHLLTAVATAKLIGGGTNTSGHVVPNVADDTVALLAASQSFTNKTLTSPVINGATAASGNLDFSGSSGTFTFPTGNVAYTGASTKTLSLVTTGAGSAITITAGAASTWSTSAGALTIDSAAALNLGTANATSAVIGGGAGFLGATAKNIGAGNVAFTVDSTIAFSNSQDMVQFKSAGVLQGAVRYGSGGNYIQYNSASHSLGLFNDNADGISTGNNVVNILIGGANVAKANVNSQWQFQSAVLSKVTASSSSTITVGAGDQVIQSTRSSTGTGSVTLPLANTGAGREIYLEDFGSGGSAQSIANAGSDTTIGLTAFTGTRVRCTSDGTSKWLCK
jgi:hypothetical protein